MHGVQDEAKSNYFGIATDGSSEENNKYLPILIRPENSKGLIVTLVLHIPAIEKSEA